MVTVAGQIYTGWLSEQLEKIGLDKSIATKWIEDLAGLVPGVEPHTTQPDTFSRNIKVEELEPVLDVFIERLSNTIDEIQRSSTRLPDER